MKITGLKMLNILGHDEFELKVGEKLTLIRGKNASGKSSIIKALQAAFKGQSVKEATLLRNGAEKGEIVVELDDNSVIRKTVTKEGSTNNQSTKFLNSLANSFGLNPVEFLLMPEKKKLETLLEIINVHVTRDELAEKVEGVIDLSDESEDKLYNLDELAVIRKQVYDERTATNRMLKDKQSTKDQMTAVLPVEYDGKRHEEVKLSIEEKRNKKEAFIQQLENEKLAEIQEVNERFAKRKQDMLDKYEIAVRPLQDELALCESNLKQIGAFEEHKKFIDSLTVDIENYGERSQLLTETLEKVDELEKSKLSNLPIKGMTINDGAIYLDGVRLEHVNSARQISFVMSLAALKMGELKAMVVDGIELLDSVKRKELLAVISKSKIQVILTQVTDDTALEIDYN